MDASHPLTEQHLTRINDALKQLDEMDRQIRMAKMAGIPMEHHEKNSAAARSQLQSIKQVYFPGRP